MDTAVPPIEIQGLSKRFGAVQAVSDLSFKVEPGRVIGFLGPNGAGKSTALRMLLGLVRKDAGEASFGGLAYEDLPHPIRARACWRCRWCERHPRAMPCAAATWPTLPNAVAGISEEDSGVSDGVDLPSPGLAALAMLAWIGGFYAAGATLLRHRDLD